MLKKCSKCGLEKERNDFGLDKYTKTGLSSRCKACKANNTAKWRQNNPDRVNAYRRSEKAKEITRKSTAKWRQNNPDKIEAYNKSERGKEVRRNTRKRYYYRNKDKENKKFREYYYNNHEKELARSLGYKKNNIEKIRVYTKESYPKRRPYILDWIKEDQKKNPAKYRARNAKRRANLLKATPPWVDLEEIRKIYENCPEGYEVDHIIPLKNSNVCGLHVPWNLQYLTKSENCSKGNSIQKV